MAWIESHQELGGHPKTKKLARILKISYPTAVGHLHYLWWWALSYAQDGDVSRYDVEDIAEAALWQGDPVEFVNALIEAEFLEPDMFIHDWEEYAGKLMDQREANKNRQKRYREKQKRNGNVTVTSQSRNGATVPYPTVPNPTVQNQENTPSTPSLKPGGEPPETAFEKLLNRYDPEQRSVVDQYWNVVRFTRKTGAVAESIKVREAEYWSGFPPDLVMEALKIHMERCQSKREDYTRGIIRRLKRERESGVNNRGQPQNGPPKNPNVKYPISNFLDDEERPP